MDSQPRSARDIEADIEAERAQLSQTLDALGRKLTVEGIVSEVKATVRQSGAEAGRAISSAVRRNPFAATVTSAGLALLAKGDKGPSTKSMMQSVATMTTQARTAVERHPAIAGAAIMALGAAVAIGLPRLRPQTEALAPVEPDPFLTSDVSPTGLHGPTDAANPPDAGTLSPEARALAQERAHDAARRLVDASE